MRGIVVVERMSNMNRRELLGALGAGIAGAAVAGVEV